MVSRGHLLDKDIRSLIAPMIRFGVVIVIVSALFLILSQYLKIRWQILVSAALILLLLILVEAWRRGIFLSLWSLQLRSLYRRYDSTGLLPLLQEYKSQERRRIEILKGISFVIISIAFGFSIDVLQSSLRLGLQLNVTPSLIATTWQIHAVIIGFSFVALTFVWEEIYSNSLSDELTRLFVEDIGSIWTVTFVFGANFVIGITSLTQSSAETADPVAVYIGAVLFTSSIVFVTWRFLDALDLLFYTDIDEELKQYAARDLERAILNEQSTPNEVLSASISGFEQVSVGLPGFSLERTIISSRDINKRGAITDLNLKRMKNIAEIVEDAQTTSIDQNPTIGLSLAEDTTVLSLKGELSNESLKEIEQQLRHGIKTRGET